MNGQRPINAVPKSIILILLTSLLMQITWKLSNYANPIPTPSLSPVPAQTVMQLKQFGDNVAAAKIWILWLQNQDKQDMDYTLLAAWLNAILYQDNQTQYPLFLASYQYVLVKNRAQQQKMLELVYEQFFADPVQRWRWLAQASISAKHRLYDLTLALEYAKILTDYAALIPDMPYWAMQMQIFILEDMGELEQAKLLIGGLLNAGLISDSDEIAFLNQRLEHLEQLGVINYDE
jgi:hypothetical protein